MNISNTEGYSIKNRRVRVECPDCGSGGGSSYPCTCHVCDNKVLMLPVHSEGKSQNWNEVFNKCQ